MYGAYYRVVSLEAALLAFVVAMSFINRLRAEILFWCVLYVALVFKLYGPVMAAHTSSMLPKPSKACVMSQKKHIVALGLAMLLLTVGALLLAINLYGLTQTLRPAFDEKSQFRFPNDFPLPIKEARSGLLKRPGEGEREYAERLTGHVAQSVAHIEWHSEYDLDRYHQRVPLWENFILHFMGRFSGIPEYERYHYSDYDKALERGVGVCGDVSIILSEVLREQGINAQIVSYPGHVVVAARFADGEEILLDPDFGVILPFGTEQLPNGSGKCGGATLRPAIDPETPTLFNQFIGIHQPTGTV